MKLLFVRRNCEINVDWDRVLKNKWAIGRCTGRAQLRDWHCEMRAQKIWAENTVLNVLMSTSTQLQPNNYLKTLFNSLKYVMCLRNWTTKHEVLVLVALLWLPFSFGWIICLNWESVRKIIKKKRRKITTNLNQVSSTSQTVSDIISAICMIRIEHIHLRSKHVHLKMCIYFSAFVKIAY